MSTKNEAPALPQEVQNLARARDSILGPRAAASAGWCGVIQSASSRKKNVMGATLVGMTRRLPAAGILKRRRMRRQPSPADRTGETKLVEPFRIVVGNAPRQNLPLPGVGGNFESLATAAGHRAWRARPAPVSRRNMLPAQQPAHELRGRYRLNLLAQSGDGEAMNAGEQPPFAPFSSWRGHSPVRAVRSVKLPRRTPPLASMRSNAFSISAAGSPGSLPVPPRT